MASDEENAERFEEALGELLTATEVALRTEADLSDFEQADSLHRAYDNLVSVMAAMREES